MGEVSVDEMSIWESCKGDNRSGVGPKGRCVEGRGEKGEEWARGEGEEHTSGEDEHKECKGGERTGGEESEGGVDSKRGSGECNNGGDGGAGENELRDGSEAKERGGTEQAE